MKLFQSTGLCLLAEIHFGFGFVLDSPFCSQLGLIGVALKHDGKAGCTSTLQLLPLSQLGMGQLDDQQAEFPLVTSLFCRKCQ